jgi:hypothetical protein
MRRVVAILALVAVLAPAALAAIQCVYNPRFGTDQRDRLLERKGQVLNDTIYGKARRDVIDASGHIRDHDELVGRRGNDTLDARDEDGADTLKGGRASTPATPTPGTWCIAARTSTSPTGELSVGSPTPLHPSLTRANGQTVHRVLRGPTLDIARDSRG